MLKLNIPLKKCCLLAVIAVLFVTHAKAQSSAYNYIVTYSPRVPITATNTLQSATVANVNQIVQYFDALGRPVQTVQTKASPSQRDVVQITAYDQYDREAVKYLPYVDSATSSGYGNYKTTALAAQSAFYANPTSSMWNAPGVTSTPFPTSNTGFESSPLNRVLEQGFPGDNWQLTGTSGATSPGHTVKTVYTCNNSASLTGTTTYWARRYAVSYTYVAGQYNYTNRLADSGAYAKDVLYITVTRNENWSGSQSDTTLNTTQEYKDKSGQVILKRTFNYDMATNTREVLSTYYVYDDYGNLAYVLPPSANPDSGAVNQRKLDNLCYQYVYDGRNRLIKKKIPGRGWDIMIYNNLNQVIGTQDSVNRMAHPQRVLYTKYDPQGRVITTGYYTISGTSGTNYWSTLQANANAETSYWETKSSSGTYSNITIPTSSATPLVTKYYDDYNVSGLPATYTVTSGVTAMTRSLPTAITTAVLNQPADALWNVLYYDDLGRSIQSYSQHYLGGHNDYSTSNYDLTTNYYNFVNQVDTTVRAHYTKANTSTAKVTDVVQYDYDQVGRKLHTQEQFYGSTGAAQTPVYLSLSNYNEIGQLIAKNIGGPTSTGSYPANITLSSAVTSNQTQTATSSISMLPGFSVASGVTFSANISGAYLQTINYQYNERGWLTALTPEQGGYGEQIYYNIPTGSAAPQYNGNISQFSYNSPQLETSLNNPATNINSASYIYDNLNRLTSSQSTLSRNDETIKYDLEGNITSIVRDGAHNSNYTFTYPGQSNQLSSVKNGSYGTRSFAYDGNGNTTVDSVLTIHYNLLNLPDTVRNGSTIISTYYYDAAGTKLRDVSTTGNGIWDYVKGIVYQNIGIGYVTTEEGRAYLQADSVYHYNYDLKDYLGNVRASYQSGTGNSPQYIQENDYYPFGLTAFQWISGTESRYLYNGKEKQPDLFNMLDYGARFYDPVIGRWNMIDPMAEQDEGRSPYNYGNNNPITNIDPTGMWTETENGWTTTDPDEIAAEVGYLQGQADVQKVLSMGSSPTNVGGQDTTRSSSSTAKTDALSTTSRIPKLRPAFGVPQAKWPMPADQGTISAYPPTPPVNYNDFGLESTSAAVGVGIINGYSIADGYAGIKGAFAAKELFSTEELTNIAFHSGPGMGEMASSEGYSILGNTAEGMRLAQLTEGMEYAENTPAYYMWAELSSKWASSVPEGSTVTVFLNNPQAWSIWLRYEKPILEQRKVITIVIDLSFK